MSNKTIGVLVMAYGTPSSLDQVEEYYAHIRRGRKPEPAQLEELVNRYRMIGGVSPLTEITRKQADGLQQLLNSDDTGAEYRVYTGMKHTHPFIDDTVKQMVEDGIKEAVGIVLAPHYSAMSVGSYIAAAEKGAEQYGGPSFIFVREWHLHPNLLEALHDRLQDAFNEFPEVEREQVHLLFTAHSLPQRILEMKDPYPDQLRETAAVLAQQMGHSNWDFAWQSAGRTADPWLGPDVLDVLTELKDKGVQNVIICPVGFVSDHLEVLYDIDIECQALAKQLGIKLVRTRSLNADPDFLAALADVVSKQTMKD